MKKLLALLLVALLAVNGYLWIELDSIKKNQNNSSQSDVNITHQVSKFDTNITDVVEAVENKVVSILSVRNNRVISSGTGVIYKSDNKEALIITNHHVVEVANEIVIKLASGEEIKGTLIGSDPYSDLALLKIKVDAPLEPFLLGDSSLVSVGEFVLAIGSPLGVEFSNSTTFGIISGKDRSIPVDLNNDGIEDWEMKVLQTDAAINPGNSGGALVNMNGELIGINSLKIKSDTVEGMGFAIPINEVVPIISEIEKHGKVSYPIIGITAVDLASVNPYYKKQYNIENEVGVMVVEILENSPAYKANLKENDLIVGFDELEIQSFLDFRKALYSKRAGDRILLKVKRNGILVDIEVNLE